MAVICFHQDQSSSSTSVATVSISTSAASTTTHRDHHVTPENPFGVIGEVATATTAFQSNYSLCLVMNSDHSPCVVSVVSKTLLLTLYNLQPDMKNVGQSI